MTSGSGEKGKVDRERSYSSATDSDDFSLFDETGDIAEQLAEEEDPLRIELQSLDPGGRSLNGNSRGGRGKKVAFAHQDQSEGYNHDPGVDKEAISVPTPAQRVPGTANKLLALIMAPSDPQTARTRGLVGQPLLYATGKTLNSANMKQIFHECVCLVRSVPVRL